MSRTEVLLSLKLIAATAEKLAKDYEAARLWPDDLELGLMAISKATDDARQAANWRDRA